VSLTISIKINQDLPSFHFNFAQRAEEILGGIAEVLERRKVINCC